MQLPASNFNAAAALTQWPQSSSSKDWSWTRSLPLLSLSNRLVSTCCRLLHLVRSLLLLLLLLELELDWAGRPNHGCQALPSPLKPTLHSLFASSNALSVSNLLCFLSKLTTNSQPNHQYSPVDQPTPTQYQIGIGSPSEQH